MSLVPMTAWSEDVSIGIFVAADKECLVKRNAGMWGKRP